MQGDRQIEFRDAEPELLRGLEAEGVEARAVLVRLYLADRLRHAFRTPADPFAIPGSTRCS